MIIVKRHHLGEKEILEVAPNRQVIDYLESYDDNLEMETDIYINNELLVNDSDFERVLKESDILTIHYRPSGYAVIAVIVIAALVLVALAPKPEVPNSVGATSTSSNNSVSGQSNAVRKYEGIPNIYGRVWSYPDLISNSVPQWILNRKQVRELLLVGEGEYEVHEIRDGSTDIDEIEESSATVYGPNTYPDDLIRIKFSEEVSDEEIIAPNDESIIWSGSASFVNSAFVYIGTNSQVVFEAPSTIKYTIDTFYGQTISNGISLVSGDSVQFRYTSLNNSTFIIDSVTESAGVSTIVVTTSDVVDETISEGVQLILLNRSTIIASSSSVAADLGIASGDALTIGAFAGTYEVNGFAVRSSQSDTLFLMSYGESFPSSTTTTTTIQIADGGGINNTIGPFTMPTTAEEIWFNVSAKSGLQSSSGGQISVNVTFYAQEIDSLGADVGSPVALSATLTGKTTKQIGQTIKMTGLDGKRYKVYAIRNTNRYSGSAIQDVFWEEVFTVNSYSGASFGNVTVIDVIAKSALSGTTSSRKINADVTRKIDGVATTNFADCVTHLITSKGKRPLSEINTDELYGIADSLSDDLKEFSFTFDDKDVSLGQAVQTACGVARVNVYRDGQEWRFNRDESKPRTYMFNRRNLASGDNQKQTFTARRPQDYDGVALRYYSRDLEDFDTVLVKIDSTTGTFIVGEYGEKPSEIELAGCSNYAQALNRAHLEARKIVYQRRGVEDTALIDAGSVDIGDRVSWCDIYDGDTFDGEITGQSGTTFYTSEPFYPVDGVTYYVTVTNDEGDAMDPVLVTASVSNPKSFIADLPEEVLLADNFSVQSGSKYVIGSIDDIDDCDYTVVSRGGDSGNGRISLELIQYSDNIYEMDE